MFSRNQALISESHTATLLFSVVLLAVMPCEANKAVERRRRLGAVHMLQLLSPPHQHGRRASLVMLPHVRVHAYPDRLTSP